MNIFSSKSECFSDLQKVRTQADNWDSIVVFLQISSKVPGWISSSYMQAEK